MLKDAAPSHVVNADIIRETAREVVLRPYFELESSRNSDGKPLVVTILEWIAKPFLWLFDQMAGLPAVLQWLIVIACVVVALLLLGHIIFTLAKAIRNPNLLKRSQLAKYIDEVDPVDFEQQAQLLGAQGDYIGAIRALFRAAIRRLEIFERKKVRPGITNRELVRRYSSTPLANSLCQFVDTIEIKWYGLAKCDATDYLACQNAHGRICQHIRNAQPAVRS